jgi:hypothetical protein
VRALEPDARAALNPFARVAVRNYAGRVVGEVAALEGWIPAESAGS